MARRRSIKKPTKRQSSQGHSGEDASTPKRKKAVPGDTRTPLQPLQTISITANKGSSVSFPSLINTNVTGNFSSTYTAPSLVKGRTEKKSIQQMNCSDDKRHTLSTTIMESCAQTRCNPETRKKLMPEFNPSNTDKENCVTVEGAKATYEHRKVTVKGQVMEDHSGVGQRDHQYRLRDTTGTITLFTKGKKLEHGGCYSVTDVSVQSQKTLVATSSTTFTSISPLKGIETSSKREVRGQIVSAKVSLQYICINCSALLPAHLNQKDVKCHKCSHTVVYRKMPQTVTADIVLKTKETSESALPFSLSHNHLQELVPFCDTGHLNTADIEQKLLEMNVCLTVEGKEVTDVCDSA